MESKYKDLLRTLAEIQNGPPLERKAEEYEALMNKVWAVLNEEEEKREKDRRYVLFVLTSRNSLDGSWLIRHSFDTAKGAHDFRFSTWEEYIQNGKIPPRMFVYDREEGVTVDKLEKE